MSAAPDLELVANLFRIARKFDVKTVEGLKLRAKKLHSEHTEEEINSGMGLKGRVF